MSTTPGLTFRLLDAGASVVGAEGATAAGSAGLAGAAAFAALCRIYEQAIPAAERKPEAALRAMLARPDYRFIVAGRGGDASPGAAPEAAPPRALPFTPDVLGFGIVFAPAGERFALLEYLAVGEACRGRGVGRELFLRCRDLALGNDARAHLLVEVESADAPGPDPSPRRRREQFYRRLGCRSLQGLAYRLPLPGPIPPMDLLALAPPPPGPEGQALGEALPREEVSREELRRWLGVIYQQVYGQSPRDPRIDLMLSAVADRVVFA